MDLNSVKLMYLLTFNVPNKDKSKLGKGNKYNDEKDTQRRN